MKRVALFCLLVLSCFILSSCADNLSKKQIFALVKDNHDFLQQCIDESEYDRIRNITGIHDTHVEKTGEYIEFYCGGAGLVPSSNYYGFYYSPTDAPLAVDVTETSMLTPKNDGWGWKEPNGDNTYYTERIMACWYYYESHY